MRLPRPGVLYLLLTASLSLARGRFEANPAGPLRFLAGRRAIVSFTLGDFRMTFGG